MRDAAGAGTAEAAGAEAVAVAEPSQEVREATALPILVLTDRLPAPSDAPAADAFVVRLGDGSRIDELTGEARARGLECVVEVQDDEALQDALERVDPEIVLLSSRTGSDGDDPLDAVLSLLPDLPAGKLAIAEVPEATRDDVVALERAGFDGVVVDVARVAELVGATPPDV